MNKKHMVFGLLFFAAFVMSIPGAAIASDTMYEAYNLTIQPGTNATELNFSWFTTDPTDIPQLIVCHEGALHGGEFPTSADYYEGEIEIVIVEEQPGPGPHPGPGPMTVTTESVSSSSASTTAEEDDTEIYACKVTMTKVKNNTKYAYAVGNGVDFSEIYYLDTENRNNYNFIFVGDPQIGASRNEDSDAWGWVETLTASLDKFDDTSFILSAGDQVERSTSDSQYNGFFSAVELTSVPFAPAIGNHDTSDLYAYHFNVSNESELGYTSGGGDYWFTYGPTLFMVLNTNNNSALSHDEFMAQAIEANPSAKWRVVVFHHALYSSARHVDDVNDLRTSMYPVMDKHDIDVVLSGHDHFYARTHQLSGGDVVSEACYEGGRGQTCVDLIGEVVEEEDLQYIGQGKVLNPSGTVYFTANSASGSKYYDFTYIEGYTNLYLAKYEQLYTPSYLNVEVNSSTLTISAYYVDDETGDSVMFDTYSILKTDNSIWAMITGVTTFS